MQAGDVGYATYISTRLYCAGCIVSVIAYFAYVALVPRPMDKQRLVKCTSPPPSGLAALTSAKSVALAASVLAICGWGFQLASIAALNHFGCKGNKGEYVTYPALPPSGRRLLGQPVESELEARCSFALSLDW